MGVTLSFIVFLGKGYTSAAEDYRFEGEGNPVAIKPNVIYTFFSYLHSAQAYQIISKKIPGRAIPPGKCRVLDIPK